MKYVVVIILFLIAGCTSTNEMIYLKVNSECPKYCSKKSKVWSGFLKVFPESLHCVCKEVGSAK